MSAQPDAEPYQRRSHPSRQPEDAQPENEPEAKRPRQRPSDSEYAHQWCNAQEERGRMDPTMIIRALGASSLLPPPPDEVTLANLAAYQESVWGLARQLLQMPGVLARLGIAPSRERLPQYSTLEHAADLIRDARRIVVLTGAGVSVSCGLPDFRSENGLYSIIKDFKGRLRRHDRAGADV
jgi:hypothetical protein